MSEDAHVTIDDLLDGSEEPLECAGHGSPRIIVFNRPSARNAMSRAMRERYAREMAAADGDATITSVIVTGAHGYFSAGVDLKENPANSNLPMFRPHPVEVNRSMSKPVIAMVDGPCVTGGLEVALSCTFVIASDRSSFVDTHIKIGGMPGWGLTSLLLAAVGARRAAQLQLSGEFIDAQTAYDWGIVNELTTADALLDRTLALAATFAGYNQTNIRRYVGLARRLEGMPADDALAIEAVDTDRRRVGL